MSRIDLNHVYKTEITGGASFAAGLDAGRPVKVSSNKHWKVNCAFQKRVIGPKVPKSRFFEHTGDEDYLWIYADEVHYITQGDTCKCEYIQNGEFDFNRAKDVSFVVSKVSVDYENYRMTIQGKAQ